MARQPAVAGQFYTNDPYKLRQELEEMVSFTPEREKAIGIISPHAGYIYSGGVAGRVYGAVSVPRDVIILGPNHHGFGARAALYPEGEWLFPTGPVPINSTLAMLINRHSPVVDIDPMAHDHEHSLEVQIPFLKYVRPDLRIVPLCLAFGDFAICKALGKGIAKAIKEYGEDVLIVASSDMTHYESAEAAREKDNLAIREVLDLNPEGLMKVCREKGITMCGVVPATVMLVAALELGAKRARLVHYANSGDVTGDNRQVVAYAAMTVS